MKKIYLLCLAYIYCLMALGQTPAGRTVGTIVADVLAQMPAQNAEQYNTLLNDLVSTKEEGVFQLIKMINPPGKGSNAQVEYALNGLSCYVSAEGQGANRIIVSNAYIKALDMTDSKDIKAFIIRQLQIVGKDEAVGKLSSLISDESLSGPACRALVSIKSDNAAKALLNALATATNQKAKKDIIEAIAEMQVTDAEGKLLAILNNDKDEDIRKVTLYALSRCGSKASLKDLSLAAEKAGYALDKSGATEAYIALLKRLLDKGDAKDAAKAANDLMKKAEKAGQGHTREAALQILMSANPGDVLKLLQAALKEDNRNYRFAALNFASEFASGNMYRELLKTMQKAPPAVKTDITNWFLQECADEKKKALIGSFATDIFIEQLENNDMVLKKATIDVLVRIGGHKSILALADLLASDNKEVVLMAKNGLLSTNGNISAAIVPVMDKATNDGKVAALELLAARKASKYGDIVFGLLTSDSQDVKAAAYAALKDVSTSGNLSGLYGLLEKSDASFVFPVQQAIINSLSEYPADKQVTLVINQMDKTSSDKKYLYYPVLAATGDKQALKMISEGFKNSTGEAQEVAFRSLLDWKGIEAAKDLLAICKDTGLSTYFDRSLSGYIGLVSNPQIKAEERFGYLNNALLLARTTAQKKSILTQLGKTNVYPAMLAVGKYLDDTSVQQEAAQAVMTIALANKDFAGKNVEDLLNKVILVLDNPDAEYQKQAIRDHLGSLIPPKPFLLPDEEKKEGYYILFDGTNMDQWTGNVTDYVLENGCISLHPSSAHGGNLYTKEEFSNFIFRFEFQLTSGANNGLGIRTPMEGDAAYVGMELQILDNEAPVYSNLAPYQYHGSVYGIIPAKRGYLKPVGEWNYQEVIANGDNIKITLNGTVILDGNIKEATKNGIPDKKNHPGLFNKKGHIGFLGHGSPVKFKNIRIKNLK